MTDPVYLDHAATTPMVPEAVEAMAEHLGRAANPSSLHASGRAARRAVEESREQVAAALGCRPGEVVFTSGGTEADNLALKGLAWARRQHDVRRRRLLTTAIEHHAVLDPLDWLAACQDLELDLLPVDHEGRLVGPDLGDPSTAALVSVMWANNEVGTVQPIDRVVAAASEHGVPVHTDAVQAVGVLPVDFAGAGVDAMTVSAHKVGGPHGVGALVARRDLELAPLLHGGGQERDVRSGTLDTPAIVGFAVALDLAVRRRAEHAAHLASLRARLVDGLHRVVPDAVLNGPGPDTWDTDRLPGNVHVSFPGCEGDSLLMLLDARGIECSTGSACSAGVPQASHVLLAMGRGEDEARSSLRFTFGRTSTEADVDAVLDAIGPAVERARAARL
jgi:cysteine desulfurase